MGNIHYYSGAKCILIGYMRVHVRTCERCVWFNGFDEETLVAKCGFR